MNKIKEFFKSAIIGGLLVVLPLAISMFALTWALGIVRSTIAPISTMVTHKSYLQDIIVELMVILLLIITCFTIGVLVRTKLGKWIYSLMEANIFLKTPGYSLIKETVGQFLGNKKSPFSSVALAQIYGNDTMVSAFITDEHADGSYTVFVPTGPNPTSGNIYHLLSKYVHPVDVSVEDTMRSIISCGAGSSVLIKKMKENEAKKDITPNES